MRDLLARIGGDGTGITLMTLRLPGSAGSGFGLHALSRYLMLALLLLPLAAPLMACSIFEHDDELVPDQPADKLYNEGLFLLNDKSDY